MTNEEYTSKFTELLNSTPKVGDILSVAAEDKDAATIWTCNHSQRKYVGLTMDCIIDLKRGPRKIIVSFSRYTGPRLKCYLADQKYNKPIHSVKVLRVSPNSLLVEPVS